MEDFYSNLFADLLNSFKKIAVKCDFCGGIGHTSLDKFDVKVKKGTEISGLKEKRNKKDLVTKTNNFYVS